MTDDLRHPTLRSFSFGGGTQSTAALVLAARGELDYRTFLFANVGEDSERPATITYVREVAMPYAEAHGLELVELRKVLRDGTPQTLMERIDATPRSIPIPVRMGKDGAPGNRTCTAEFKIRVVEKELKRRGATKAQRATVGIGISLDEWTRAGTPEDPRSPYQLRDYPLLDAKLTRADCQRIIREAGIPQPPRSACYFCPFHTAEEWRRMARQEPDLFERAAQLEDKLHERGKALGRGEFYLTRYGVPLRELFDGRWVLGPDEYAAAVARYADEVGQLAWAAPQDWMCEPQMITGGPLPDGTRAHGTGLSVREHQERTVANFLDLRDRGPWFIPVLQGFTLDEYHACADLYASAGVDLAAEPLVGLGSVCRREATPEIGRLVRELAARGFRLHGFGVKKAGLARYGEHLASADSMAWSTSGRKNGPLPGCTHRTCANCQRYALRWREQLLDRLAASLAEAERRPRLFA